MKAQWNHIELLPSLRFNSQARGGAATPQPSPCFPLIYVLYLYSPYDFNIFPRLCSETLVMADVPGFLITNRRSSSDPG